MSLILDPLSNFTTIVLSLVVILGTLIYFAIFRKDPYQKKCVNKFAGPPLVPLLGNIVDLAGPSHEMLKTFARWSTKYGGDFRFWLANKPYVCLVEASSVEKILSSNVNIEKGEDYGLFHAWLGAGLLTSSGAKWFARRKLLTPAFHFKILDDFLEVFNEQASTLVQVLSTNCPDGKIVDVFPYITHCALDIICETAMGKKIHAQNQHDSEYVRAVLAIGQMVMMRLVRPWLKPEAIWRLTSHYQKEKQFLKTLHGFTTKVIEEKKLEKKERESAGSSQSEDTVNKKEDDTFFTKKRRLAFLDLLLEVAEDGKVLTDLDIREETDTFMFEGHDTTAAGMSWTLVLLAANPDCQEKVREELDGIFGGEPDREITTSDLAQMKYLELCIKESLRIFPSVPQFARRVKKDVILDDGKIIPVGAQIFITAHLLHRDPKVFPNPEEFHPERFLSENKRHPYSYVPFSAGPRNCIGQKFANMEEKVVLAKILLNFNLEAGEAIKDIVPVPDMILRPQNGIKLKLRKRVRN